MGLSGAGTRREDSLPDLVVFWVGTHRARQPNQLQRALGNKKPGGFLLHNKDKKDLPPPKQIKLRIFLLQNKTNEDFHPLTQKKKIKAFPPPKQNDSPPPKQKIKHFPPKKNQKQKNPTNTYKDITN